MVARSSSKARRHLKLLALPGTLVATVALAGCSSSTPAANSSGGTSSSPSESSSRSADSPYTGLTVTNKTGAAFSADGQAIPDGASYDTTGPGGKDIKGVISFADGETQPYFVWTGSYGGVYFYLSADISKAACRDGEAGRPGEYAPCTMSARSQKFAVTIVPTPAYGRVGVTVTNK